MKLLTTGGLLYSSVQAANPDGTTGTYQSLDYVAILPETANMGLISNTVNIGWDPVVTEIIANYDGGKTIAGIGKITGTIYASWVIKMWGSTGTGTNCGADSKIAGYVTMAVGLNSDLALTANCSLTSNAKVQWAWTSLKAADTLIGTSPLQYSYVVTAASEDWAMGFLAVNAQAANGTVPYIIVAGGTTLTIDVTTYSSFGMGSWIMVAEYITDAGLTATTTGTGKAATPLAIGTTNSMEIIFKAASNMPFLTAADVGANAGGITASNHCWTAVAALPFNSSTGERQAIGGFTHSITSCLQHAVDGYSFWGGILYALVMSDFSAGNYLLTKNPGITIIGAIDLFPGTGLGTFNPGAVGTKGLNFAQPRVIAMRHNFLEAAAAVQAIYILCTSQEYFYNSVLLASSFATPNTTTVSSGQALTKVDHGQLWNLWIYDSDAAATSLLTAQVPDRVVFCGTRVGVGILTKYTMAVTGLLVANDVFTVGVENSKNMGISAPTGGMGQFKGLTYTTTEAKYVQTVCKSVAPMYYTAWKVLLATGASNGFVVSCYTGIPQCEVSLADGFTRLNNTTGTETATCMNDPRYMTWRAMTVSILYNGTLSWYRTDSYWNSAKTMFSSTMGTGVVLSTSVWSDSDNNGATYKGQTFVFAYGDGSGIQLNHVAFGTTPHASNNSPGAGTNTLSTAPTDFKNTSPDLYNQQYCLGSNLELTGTTDTSGLSSTITEWSDGYKAKITLNLEMILPGAAGGWRGICLVYYSSQYVMDNTNGAICFAAQVDSATGKGPTDFASGYLMSVASSVWQPPANKASLQPNSSSLTGGKYDITYSPAAATGYMYTEGYYSSVTWYQPKYASSYSGVARYGKDDYVGSYCMQGAGSNSYFGATAASVKLTGALYLAVGVISLGTVLSLAI